MRARVCTTTDASRARARAAAAIGGADLRAPSLPPAAILCVRRVWIGTAIGAPLDIGSARRFEQALQHTLDELARNARRPADGPIDWCEAVVFEDLSELLACLAQDWAGGRVADRWWWRALLGQRVTLDVVVNAWTEAGPHIAPAFERLVAAREVAAFASMLDARQVRAVTEAMLRAHGGPAVAELLAGPPAAASTSAAGRRVMTPRTAPPIGILRSVVAGSLAASSSAPLRRDQCAMLAAAAVARRHPSFLQQTWVGDAFRQALDGLDAAPETPAPMEPLTPGASPGPSALSNTRALADPPVPVHHVEPPAIATPEWPWAPGDDRSSVQGEATIPARDEARRSPPAPAPDITRAPRPIRQAIGCAVPAPTVEIPLGGIFYLLNVAIGLRLYGDFTQPQRRRLALSPWDFLALVAEHWLAEPLDDGTAGLLASLAGRRPDERAGEQHFNPHRVARWTARIVRRINRRVTRALDAAAERPAARRLLCHPARVYVTAAHVDVLFDLASLPIDIRLAGLDRDPGWIPSAGRVVRFHYS